MDPHLLARSVAVGRVLIGAALIAEPERLLKPWVGSEGTRPAARVLGRSLGTRDLVIGAGAISCEDAQLPVWLLAAIAADVTDLFATVGAGRALPFTGRVLVGATAFGGAALGLAALSGLRG